jgi:hypothetical protein
VEENVKATWSRVPYGRLLRGDGDPPKRRQISQHFVNIVIEWPPYVVIIRSRLAGCGRAAAQAFRIAGLESQPGAMHLQMLLQKHEVVLGRLRLGHEAGCVSKVACRDRRTTSAAWAGPWEMRRRSSVAQGPAVQCLFIVPSCRGFDTLVKQRYARRGGGMLR